VYSLHDAVSERSRLLLTALFGASVGVLLIACTNLASLLLARGLSRRRELAVRAAMGAGRERLVRQLLTESLVLALAGGLLGVLAGIAAAPLAGRLVPNTLPIPEAPDVDLRFLAFAAAATLATGVGFGVLPARRAFAEAAESGLAETARTGAGRRTERLRALLVVGEVSASVALLIASGLLIRALARLQRTDPGFRPQGVLTLRTALPLPRYEEPEPRLRFYERVLAEVRQLPGVASAAYTSFLPMVMRGGIWTVRLPGEPDDGSESAMASLRFVSPGFFDALAIPLRRGRDVAESDTLESPRVAVVSESFVRRSWPGEDPIGSRFQFALEERTVVGVSGDVRVRGLERTSEPQVYLPYRQHDSKKVSNFYAPKDLVVRASLPAATLVPALRRIVNRADAGVPLSDVKTLVDVVADDTAPRRLQARVIGGFAALAFLLAGVGVYGLLAFTVSERSREIGVRLALGAQTRDVAAMVVRRGFRLAAGGVILGAALAYAAGRSMQALLFGVSPADLPTFAAAIALSLAMALLGSLSPALRAARLDPLAAIRAE
jgi:predicted permease